MSQEKKDKQVIVMLPESVLNKLLTEASREGTSVSAIGRRRLILSYESNDVAVRPSA